MKTLLYISFFVLIYSHASFAQKDTAINLNEVQITSSRLSFNSGLRQYSFDSTLLADYKNSSLSDLLNENSAIYLKNYGPGGLSTISLRGGSAYHTTIMWNGFSLASPMHGLTDLSLERNFLFDDVGIQFGGTSSLWGSGAVSGSILLFNKPDFDRGFNITAGINAGSFSEFSQFAGVAWSNKKYSGSLKIYNEYNKNNFTYEDEYSQTLQEQTHSRIKQYGFMNDNYFRTGKSSLFNFRIWLTYSDREIPPAIQQVNSQASQQDINNRYSAEWKYSGNKTEFTFRSAYFLEKLNYNDDFLTRESENKCRSFINEVNYEIRFSPNHLLQAGVNHTYAIADPSSNFNEARDSRLSLFTLYRYNSNNEKIESSLSARKEFSQLTNSNLIFSAGINYYLLKSLLVRFSGSTVYRNPTLNDLYWIPGGNNNLKSENGYSVEGGFQLNLSEMIEKTNKTSPSSIIINSTVYYKNINDWIIWYPSTSNLWSPQNLLEVKSRGLESSLEYRYNVNSFSAGCSLEFFYTLSTNEKPLLANDASLHQQLIYVPKYRWNGRLFILYKYFGLSFNHSYTGYRYTSSDNLSYLDPFTLDNLQIDKLFRLNSSQLKIFVRVSNIFNSNYQSVLNRPMPLRSFNTGITFTFNKNKHIQSN